MRVNWQEATTRLRARSGRSLASFSKEVRMDELSLNRLARGEVTNPRWDQACLLLDVCADWLTEHDWQAVRAA